MRNIANGGKNSLAIAIRSQYGVMGLLALGTVALVGWGVALLPITVSAMTPIPSSTNPPSPPISLLFVSEGGTVTAVDASTRTATVSYYRSLVPERPCPVTRDNPDVTCGGNHPRTDTLIEGQVLILDSFDQAENDITSLKVGDRVIVYTRSNGSVRVPYAVKDFGLIPSTCDSKTGVCSVPPTPSVGGGTTPSVGGGTAIAVDNVIPIPSQSTSGVYVNPPTKINATLHRSLHAGVKGDDVTALQQKLQALRYLAPSAPTSSGVLDKTTASAIREYQKDHGLQPVGYLNPATRVEMNKLKFGPVLAGDFNRDGKVNQEEVQKIADFIAGKAKPTEDELTIADSNGDGYITIVDWSAAVSNMNLKKPYLCTLAALLR